MRKLSKGGSVYDLITMLAVVFGVVVGALELRGLGEAREREARLELLRLSQSAEYNRALLLVSRLPDSLGVDALAERTGPEYPEVLRLLSLWEGLGVLVYRKDIPLTRVEDLYSGAILVSWDKLRPSVREYRTRSGDQTRAEWFQWLAERIRARAQVRRRSPAYLLYQSWTP